MRRATLAAASLAIILGAGPVYAHSEIEGIGSFYTGLLHPFLAPSHVLTMASAGLLLGQLGRAKVRAPLLLFLTVYAGALAATQWGVTAGGETGLFFVAAFAGGLVTLGSSFSPTSVSILIAAAAGAALGLDSGATGSDLPSTLLILFGTFIAGAYVVFCLAVFTSDAPRHWQRIGVRIVGSWTAASSFLVLALELSRSRL